MDFDGHNGIYIRRELLSLDNLVWFIVQAMSVAVSSPIYMVQDNSHLLKTTALHCDKQYLSRLLSPAVYRSGQYLSIDNRVTPL